MDSQKVIQFDRVSKKFFVNREHMYVRSYFMRLPEIISGKGKSVHEVLQDVSFTINRGELVGIVGQNGSGKSTLLKMMCNIIKPTQGTIHVHGKIAPLLELGAGFHPELSGRENVYLYGAILGMRKSMVQKNWDSIIEFAQIGDFLDTKIKHFSSGMLVRLGFSVAIHLEYDILVADEVLSVGDASFQEKCIREIQKAHQLKKTIIFVSHDERLINRLATKTIHIQGRKISISAHSKTHTEFYNENILRNIYV